MRHLPQASHCTHKSRSTGCLPMLPHMVLPLNLFTLLVTDRRDQSHHLQLATDDSALYSWTAVCGRPQRQGAHQLPGSI